jgi:CRP/FNR family cyclic AMP-dependent transcriptional regulator
LDEIGDNHPMDLRVISLFEHLSDAELTRIRGLCSLRSFAKGEEIVGDHDSTTDVFFILSGTVRVISFTDAGREFIFNEVSAGAIFGEFSAIDRLPRSASGVALSDCTLARMPASVFLTVLQENNGICLKLAELMVAKIRDMSARLFETSVLALRERVRRELLRLATTVGKPDGPGIMINPAPTHYEIAARIGSHREAVTREVNRLERKKVLEVGRRTIRITDLDWLKDDED